MLSEAKHLWPLRGTMAEKQSEILRFAQNDRTASEARESA
jgi:hypothetical protein